MGFRISDLQDAALPLTGAELLELEQVGGSRRVRVMDLLPGFESTLASALANEVDPDEGAALMAWLLDATGATALRQDVKNAERVSVASFGVTGVGDDTDAMAKAIAWQLSKRQTYNPTIGGGVGSALVTCPVLTIPNGWRVKVQGDLQPPAFLVAEGRASIESLDNTKDIFKGNDSYKSYFGFLNFLGGKTQVRLQNANINAGTWTLDSCTFEGSYDYAVQFLNTSGSYAVTSTQPFLINCNFIRCKRGVKSMADHTFHLGGWLQPEGDFFDPDTAFMWTNGLYSINWVMTIPGGVFPARARWFDCWGSVRGLQTRFGGEGGGLPVVYWFATPTRYLAGTAESIEMGVSFHQCTLYGGNGSRPDRGIVNFRGQLAPIVRITDSVGGIICPYLVNESAANGGIPDIAAYLANLKTAWNGDDLFGDFSFHFTGNKKKNNGNLLWPAELDAYVYTDKPYLPRIAVLKNSASISLASGTTPRLSLDQAESDPYSLKYLEVDGYGVKAPAGARFATLTGYIEFASHTANQLQYLLRLYKNNNPIPQGTADKKHTDTGVVRIHVQATVPCVANDSFTLRASQASGAPLTVTLASMSVEFK